MGLRFKPVSVDEVAQHMGLSDNDRDNIKNRINKRVLKMVSDLGTNSKEYKQFISKAGEMGFKMTLVNRKVKQTSYKADIKSGSFGVVVEDVDVQILSRGKYAKGMTDRNLIELDKLTKSRPSRKAQELILQSAGIDTKGLSKADKLERARLELGKKDFIENWFNENPDLIYEILIEKGWERLKDHSNEEIVNAIKELTGQDENTRKERLGNYESWADRYEKEGGDSLRIRRKRAEQEAMTGGRAARRQAATQKKKAKYTI